MTQSDGKARESGTHRPRILIISFSPIHRDARVLKQVHHLAQRGDVTTCGLGQTPDGVVEHLRIPSGLALSKPYSKLLARRLFRFAYWRQAGVRWARKSLARRRFDLIVANDLDAVPLAFALDGGARIHADLHEYSPLMRAEVPDWVTTRKPYYEWILRRFVRRAARVTTVSRGIADAYAALLTRDVQVVENAAPYRDGNVRPTGSPIRLVHSGAAMAHRGIEQVVDAVASSAADVQIDLYLVPASPEVMGHATGVASRDSRIRVHDPVPYAELNEVLAASDLGVHVLLPVNMNHKNALPNKVFDYVQARLGVLVGPSPEMARVVGAYGFGVVTETFEVPDIARAIESLTPDRVDELKRAAHRAAHDLSAEVMSAPWLTAWDAILTRRADDPAPRACAQDC